MGNSKTLEQFLTTVTWDKLQELFERIMKISPEDFSTKNELHFVEKVCEFLLDFTGPNSEITADDLSGLLLNIILVAIDRKLIREQPCLEILVNQILYTTFEEKCSLSLLSKSLIAINKLLNSEMHARNTRKIIAENHENCLKNLVHLLYGIYWQEADVRYNILYLLIGFTPDTISRHSWSYVLFEHDENLRKIFVNIRSECFQKDYQEFFNSIDERLGIKIRELTEENEQNTPEPNLNIPVLKMHQNDDTSKKQSSHSASSHSFCPAANQSPLYNIGTSSSTENFQAYSPLHKLHKTTQIQNINSDSEPLCLRPRKPNQTMSSAFRSSLFSLSNREKHEGPLSPQKERKVTRDCYELCSSSDSEPLYFKPRRTNQARQPGPSRLVVQKNKRGTAISPLVLDSPNESDRDSWRSWLDGKKESQIQVASVTYNQRILEEMRKKSQANKKYQRQFLSPHNQAASQKKHELGSGLDSEPLLRTRTRKRKHVAIQISSSSSELSKMSLISPVNATYKRRVLKDRNVPQDSTLPNDKYLSGPFGLSNKSPTFRITNVTNSDSVVIEDMDADNVPIVEHDREVSRQDENCNSDPHLDDMPLAQRLNIITGTRVLSEPSVSSNKSPTFQISRVTHGHRVLENEDMDEDCVSLSVHDRAVSTPDENCNSGFLSPGHKEYDPDNMPLIQQHNTKTHVEQAPKEPCVRQLSSPDSTELSYSHEKNHPQFQVPKFTYSRRDCVKRNRKVDTHHIFLAARPDSSCDSGIILPEKEEPCAIRTPLEKQQNTRMYSKEIPETSCAMQSSSPVISCSIPWTNQCYPITEDPLPEQKTDILSSCQNSARSSSLKLFPKVQNQQTSQGGCAKSSYATKDYFSSSKSCKTNSIETSPKRKVPLDHVTVKSSCSKCKLRSLGTVSSTMQGNKTTTPEHQDHRLSLPSPAKIPDDRASTSGHEITILEQQDYRLSSPLPAEIPDDAASTPGEPLCSSTPQKAIKEFESSGIHQKQQNQDPKNVIAPQKFCQALVSIMDDYTAAVGQVHTNFIGQLNANQEQCIKQFLEWLDEMEVFSGNMPQFYACISQKKKQLNKLFEETKKRQTNLKEDAQKEINTANKTFTKKLVNTANQVFEKVNIVFHRVVNTIKQMWNNGIDFTDSSEEGI